MLLLKVMAVGACLLDVLFHEVQRIFFGPKRLSVAVRDSRTAHHGGGC